MTEEKLLKCGKCTACVTPLAWGMFFTVGFLYGDILGNIDAGMVWLCVLIVPLFAAGTLAAVWWPAAAYRNRAVFQVRPTRLAVWNVLALVLGLCLILPWLCGW